MRRHRGEEVEGVSKASARSKRYRVRVPLRHFGAVLLSP
jgi:hypothetical protein